MKVVVLGTGTSNGQDLERYLAHSSFRKATRCMKLAHDAMGKAVAQSSLSFSDLKTAAFILGSSYGELENTKEFLKAWVKSGLARPILFQSSLHNGTLGFLALECALPGPSFTVSQHYFTGEKSLELAMSLIQGGIVETCLVSSVDSIPAELAPALKSLIPSDMSFQDGAGALLIASENFSTRNGLKPLAELQAIEYQVECSPNHAQSVNLEPKKYYDSDGLQRWIEALDFEKKRLLENLIENAGFPNLMDLYHKSCGTLSR